ncbi:fatty acid desaturase [Paenibacillus sp. IB182496]|uniref:Fatty acid desaturase n=1 Tax=Paenibacillus sabuli TaxID=2772509 RepID=A0A927GUX2_9BACL|nr:fatty acid desaturase [Paenibacillus sabuli]MBD2848610.1 fatty acid desaturase [Paenibacillus sabuli]
MESVQEFTQWKKEMAKYSKADIKKSIWQLVNTIIPFVLLWGCAYISLTVSIWLSLALIVPAAGFLIRIFIIFHDCCHQAFFRNKKANEIVGTLTGILTFFPFGQWKNEHSIHHATSGNLSRRGIGDIWTLTTEEYAALPFHKRLGYRLYRNPFILFGLGPIYLFLFAYRMNRKEAKQKERWNTYLTNIGLLALMALLGWTLGWQEVLLIQGAILYLSGAGGIWLFYVQHQFETTYYEHADQWDYISAAVHGSSYYKLPPILQWITGNIGFHHVHHLMPQAPNYYLQRIHESHASLKNVPVVAMRSSLQALRYRLWDEKSKRYVGLEMK